MFSGLPAFSYDSISNCIYQQSVELEKEFEALFMLPKNIGKKRINFETAKFNPILDKF